MCERTTVRKLGVMVTLTVTMALTLSSAPVAEATAAISPHITPTAVAGADGYLWMLETYPCATATCPVLMRSSDGGRFFLRVGTPPASMYGIEFANRQDLSRLYWTDDGGKSWRLVFARFRYLAPQAVVITPLVNTSVQYVAVAPGTRRDAGAFAGGSAR
jgi:hypothetical protein